MMDEFEIGPFDITDDDFPLVVTEKIAGVWVQVVYQDMEEFEKYRE